MPRIQIQMLEGRSVEQKRKLARGLVDAAADALGIDKSRFSVIMIEVPEENLAHGGLLWCDREEKPPV